MLGRSGRRSPGVRTLIPDEEAAVLAACSRCNRCSLPPSTAASSSSDSQLVTPNNSKVPEDFSVVGVLDSPLGILLLYLFSHSLDRCSGPVTDTYDANVKRERSRSNEEKNVRKSRQKRRMNKSEFKEIHPFCYVDIKWLLQFEERHLETPMSDIKSVGRGGEGGRVVGGGGQGCDISIANRESPKGKGKRRMKTEEVVERVAFLENTMVVVTKTNLRVTVLAPQTETVDLEVEHNWYSQRGSQGSIRESKIDRLTLMSDGGNGSGHAGAGTMDVSRSQSGSGYIGEGSKENVKFSNSNAATDTSKRWEVEERVENDDDENDEFKIIGGTIFTFHLKGL